MNQRIIILELTRKEWCLPVGGARNFKSLGVPKYLAGDASSAGELVPARGNQISPPVTI